MLIYTLGGFRVWHSGVEIKPTAWGREKAIHLFQYLVTNRQQHQHKEQIIDQLWPEINIEAGDRDFKVALNAINKALEPDRAPRTQPRFIRRFDLAYGINLDEVWIDAIWLPQGIYNVWVVGYQEGLRVSDGQWLDLLGEPGQIFKDSEGNPTPSDTGVPYTVTANHAGQVNRTLVYIVPDDAVVGSPWEIVLDDGDNNSDGHPFFDKYKDGLDAYETGDYGFVVTPELPTAILLSLGLVGLGGYLGVTRRRRVSREARL